MIVSRCFIHTNNIHHLIDSFCLWQGIKNTGMPSANILQSFCITGVSKLILKGTDQMLLRLACSFHDCLDFTYVYARSFSIYIVIHITFYLLVLENVLGLRYKRNYKDIGLNWLTVTIER